jgi:hypothetical protein
MPTSIFQKLLAFHSNVKPSPERSREPSQVGFEGKGDRDRDRNGGGFRDRLDRDREGEEILVETRALQILQSHSLKYVEYFVTCCHICHGIA